MHINRKQLRRSRSAALLNSPQRRSYVIRLRIITPRKPNSAKRSCVKVKLTTKKGVHAYIHGSGHNLRKYSKILIRGGGARDLPGVRYSTIRGVLDLMPAPNKTKRRTIYGLSFKKAYSIPYKKNYFV